MAEPRDTEVLCIASVSQSGTEQMEQPVGRDALGKGQTRGLKWVYKNTLVCPYLCAIRYTEFWGQLMEVGSPSLS